MSSRIKEFGSSKYSVGHNGDNVTDYHNTSSHVCCQVSCGDVFPMLEDVGEGYGSVKLNINEIQIKNCVVKVYPHMCII